MNNPSSLKSLFFLTLVCSSSALIQPKDKEKKAKKTTSTAQKPATDGWYDLQGVRYQVITKPSKDAKSVQKNNRVKVHYTGWLSEQGACGTKIDSSFERKRPIEFIAGVGQVIKGWDIIIIDMKVGEKRKVKIPGHLAYGARGAGSVVPPHADLIFEIEIISA